MLDQLLETTKRVGGLHIPQNCPPSKQQQMKYILQNLQRVIHDVNPYVKDFKLVIEEDYPDKMHVRIVLGDK